MGIFTRSKKKAETEKVEVHNAPPMPTKPKQAEINPSVVQANVPLNQLIVGGPLAVVLVVGVVMGLFYAFFYVGVIIGIAVILFGIANAMAQQEGKVNSANQVYTAFNVTFHELTFHAELARGDGQAVLTAPARHVSQREREIQERRKQNPKGAQIQRSFYS